MHSLALVTLAYTVQPVAEETTAQQKASFTALLQSLGQASKAEIEAVMAEREVVEPEQGLNLEVINRLQQGIKQERSRTVGIGSGTSGKA